MAASQVKRRGPPFLAVLFIGLLLAVMWFASDAWGKRQAAIRHCGKAHFVTWRPEFGELLASYDRVADAASAAPRLGLAPLLLRLTEAEAMVAKSVPPPCAASGQQLTLKALSTRTAAFRSFALHEGRSKLEEFVAQSRAEALEGGRLIDEAQSAAR